MYKSDLSGADLSEANLGGTHLDLAKLNDAKLRGANLKEATLTDTQIHGALLTGCSVYGISAWNLEGVPKDQSGLIIEPDWDGRATITVDDLLLAQFIFSLLHNPNVQKAIDAVTSTVVLILGRFSNERKPVLDDIRAALNEPRARRLDQSPSAAAARYTLAGANAEDASALSRM